MNSYVYTHKHGVHCFRFVDSGTTTFAAFMEHIAQIIEQAVDAPLRLFVDVQHKGEEVNVLEILSTIRMIEKRLPDRPSLRVAVIESDKPLIKTIRVVYTIISRRNDRFHVFLPHESDAAWAWLRQE